jgi:hypothetical protein
MQPCLHRNPDGSLTITLTLPAHSGRGSLLKAEEELMRSLNAVGCASMKHLLEARDADGAPMIHNGMKWTSKGQVDKIYETPWGEVMISRHVYQTSSGGKTWCPLEHRANIIGTTATPHLARSLSHKYANQNAMAVIRDLEENHARKLAPSYVADVAAAVADLAGKPVVEENAHAPESKPEQVASAVLGLDGTCALFCGEGFKQCMVGTISLYDKDCQRLETIYLAQPPEMGKEEFLTRLDGEWHRIGKTFPKANRVGLSDGARDYEPWLKERTHWQILDFYHASGYLTGAAAGMHRSKKARQSWLEESCHTLKNELGAARRLSEELSEQDEQGSKVLTGAKALHAAAGYFSHNIERMDYAMFSALNFPIGSGVTEAACKTLVKARLCGSGMKWTRAGAKTVLTLRSILLSSSRWASLWKFLDTNRF